MLIRLIFIPLCSLLFCWGVFAQTPKQTPDLIRMKADPEYKRQWEEYEKKLAEVIAKNKENERKYVETKKLLDEGVIAFKQKNNKLALVKFNEALSVDDYWVQHVPLLTNKVLTLLQLGVESYNLGIRTNKRSLTAAHGYFKEAVDCVEKIAILLEQNKDSEEPEIQKLISDYHYQNLRNRGESYRLFSLTDPLQIPTAISALESYIAVETNKDLKELAIKNLEKLRSKPSTFPTLSN